MSEENKINFGSIQIHKKVLADIASTAIEEIDGVHLRDAEFSSFFRNLFNRQSSSGVRVSVDSDNQVSIEVKITVKYGLNIPDIAGQVQEKIRTNVERTADVMLKDVHVNIQGIERGNT